MSNLYTVQDGIALVTLSNPPVNALSWALRQHVVAAINAANRDASVQAIVLHGAGKAGAAAPTSKNLPTLPTSSSPCSRP